MRSDIDSRFRQLLLASSALLVALVLSPAVSHAIDVDLIWTYTSGSGTTGGSSIAVAPGDTLELAIVVTPGPAGLVAASVSVFYNHLLVTATSAEECDGCIVEPSLWFSGTTGGGVGSTAESVGNADLDSDGKVGLPDFALFRTCLWAPPPVDPPCDLNRDGLITTTDYTVSFKQAFGAPGVIGFPTGAVQMIESQTIGYARMDPFTFAWVYFTATGTGTVTPSVTYLAGIDGFVEPDGDEFVFSVPPQPPSVPSLSLPFLGLLVVFMATLGVFSVRASDDRGDPRLH